MEMKFIIGLLLMCVSLLPGKGYGQTSADLELSYRNEYVNGYILVCNDGEPPFRFQLKNETGVGKFISFKLSLGDGSDEIDMAGPGGLKTIEYKEKGSFNLKFIGERADGIKVIRGYVLKIVGKVNARLERENEWVKCLDSDVKYTLVILSGDTDRTRYFLDYDDGSGLDELDRSKLVNGQGVFVHQYKESYCSMFGHEEGFKVSLTYENECYSGELGTLSEAVAVPFNARFTFDHLGKREVCTYEKLELRNITTGGTDSDCGMGDPIAFWDFGNGETSEEWEPYIEYKQVGIDPYKIKLKVSNKYACATDSVEYPVNLINRTEAIMALDKNELCVGEELLVENRSWGDQATSTWSVVSLDGFPVPEYVDRGHLRLKFNHWGRYRITLYVENVCSHDQTDTVVTVRQDPELVRYDLPAQSCLPEAVNMASYVSVAWNGNEEKANWTITRKGGVGNADVEWLDGTGAQSPFPVFRFRQAGVYQVKMQLPDAGCGGTKLTGMKEIVVYDPAISVKIDTTSLNICENGVVSFTNTSVGDRLQYEWSVKPSAKTSFANGTNPTSASPVIRFDKYGDYEVKLHMYTSSGCGAVDMVYKVHVRKDPSIFFFEPPEAVCPGPAYPFFFSSSVIYEFYNNPERVKWTISPDDGGWEFLEGDIHTPKPTVLFHKPGNYSFTVELESAGCPDNTMSKIETRNIRVRNSAMSITGIVTDNLVCEGDSLSFVLKAETAENDPLMYAWTVTPPDNTVAFGDYGNDKRVAEIRFGHWGDYEVRGAATGFCGTLDTTFRITVQKDPKVALRQIDGVCMGEYDMRDYVTYQWFNNVPEVGWEVKGVLGEGVGYVVDDIHAEYPKITFNKPGDYSVKVGLISHTLGCEEDSLQDIKMFHVYDPEILGNITMVGTGEICEGETVTFMNTTNADGGIRWEWRVEGTADGYVFQDGGRTSTEQLPVITFTKYGDYRVFAKAVGPCSEKEFPFFPVTVSGVPEVTIADVLAVCEPFDFKGKEDARIIIDPRNDAVRTARWLVTENPDVISGGYEYLGMSADTSLYPDIRFHNGDYTVEVKYWNRCQTPGKAVFRIQADKFIPITSIRDDSICTRSREVRLLTAEPANGIWSLKNADIPHAGEILYNEGDNYYFNPQFGAYEELDVPLVYKLYNFSCVDSAEMKMHVWPLPHVEAGIPREMCLNHAPQLLVGQDSTTGTVWQQNRGNWYLGEQLLPEHHFQANGIGDFTVFYRYEDVHHCVNADSTVMTVHALPDTAFTSKPQYCRGVLADFTVNEDVEIKRYMWEYYVGAVWDTLPGNGGFVYDSSGYYDVTLVAESVHGCLDTSAVHRIEVVNDAPPADFTFHVDKKCGPKVSAEIKVEEGDYSDHNLHFEWVLGNGTRSEALVPDNPQVFYSTQEDTVYQLKFRVYNICNETEKIDSLSVGSLPHADFRLENGERNCSPLTLRVLNTSTGSHNRYFWNMGDGSEPLNVFEPLDYLYVTDSVRKVFDISLVAINGCGRDSLMQPLTVLAQSIRAFFDRPKDDICVGEQICFTNYTRDTAREITHRYWDFGDEVRDTSWNVCHAYRDSGRYKVLLYVDNGCSSDTTSKFINVIGNPKIDLQLEQENCDRDTFHFAFATDQHLKWIKWTLGDESEMFLPSFSYVYKEPGSYPVRLEAVGDNRAACRSVKEALLTVHPRPVLHIVPWDTLVCSPYLYVPQVEGEADKMMWDYGDGSPETSAGEHWYVNTTDSLLGYEVVLHAVSDKGCPEDYTGYMHVAALPHAVLEKRVTNGRPQKVELMNMSPEGYVDYIWVLPENRIEHTAGNQYLEFMENGIYTFSLITENQYGCRDTATLEHEVMLKGLYFPNTFIPHSLNGQVNRFNGIGMGLVRYKLEIFDQHSNKIWETTALKDGKPSEGWDGCNRKGERLPQGVYIWRAEAIFGNDDVWTGKNNDSGIPETTQGTVLLLRE